MPDPWRLLSEIRKNSHGRGPVPKMPRALKYCWGAAVTALLVLALSLDQGSRWLPVIHNLIDLLQDQHQPHGRPSPPFPALPAAGQIPAGARPLYFPARKEVRPAASATSAAAGAHVAP